MQKTTHYFLFLLIVTGLLFTGCRTKDQPVDTEETTGFEVEDDGGDNGEDEDTASDTTTTTTTTTAGTYKDGTYTATGSYNCPAGPSEMGVTLTLVDNTVTDVSISSMDMMNTTVLYYQGVFDEEIDALVVGKKLDEIGSFRSVSGASLTPKGFTAALEAIKLEAAS